MLAQSIKENMTAPLNTQEATDAIILHSATARWNTKRYSFQISTQQETMTVKADKVTMISKILPNVELYST
jgi:hypothetical protein